MKNNSFIVILLLLAATSCKTNQALDFSNKIVEKYKQLLPEAQLTDNKVKAYMNDNSYDSIVAIAEKMEKITDDKMQEVQNLVVPDVNNAQAFKQSVIDYFTYIKSIYTGYKNFGLANPGRDRNNAGRIVMLIVKNKDSVVNQMQRIQKAFAASNGFKIE